ncbi:MAG: Nramp family divalent metal transporter [Candidatus Thermoplasmatota archaeon]|jgi:Mn2+/Fe2+ NRAMP family transporter|nr:Nramp family divalent metal transporter [Candidatus Thermoplasmatota archaeon]
MEKKPRNYLRYLKYFGPGAVVACMTIGAGDIVLAPRIGAWAVPLYSALWVITFAMITKGLTAYLATRYSLLSGEHIMTLFSRVRPYGWINIFSLVTGFLLLPFLIATFLTILGNVFTLFTGTGDFIIWGVSLGLFIALFGALSSYKIIERIQLVFVIFLCFGAIVAVAVVNPDWFAILKGLFTPQVPTIATWVTSEDIIAFPVMFQLAAIYGTMHGTYADITAYISWWILRVQEKKVALKSEIMTGVKLDLFISFTIVAIFMVAFLAAGVVILGQRQIVPNGVDLISAQQSIYTQISPIVGNVIYPIAMVGVIAGSIYAGMDAVPRMIKAWLDPLSKRVQKISFKRFQLYIVLYLLFTSVPLMFFEKPIILMTIYLLLTGVFGMWLLGWGALWANQKKLPKEQRLGKTKMTLFVISNIAITVFVLSIFIL